MLRRRLIGLALASAAVPAVAADPLPPLRVERRRLLDPAGRAFAVKGINLGNWLVPEGYMFKFKTARSPRRIYAAFERILGVDGAAAFWARWRDVYVDGADIRFIAAAGFNVVRVPFHYASLVRHGTPTRFEGEGYARLDALVAWARAAGLRVILDMHAAPGGQTGFNHDDGSGYPLMFYVPAHRALTIAIWRRLAARYRGEPAMLGFDLLNEPVAPYHDVSRLNNKLEGFYRDATAAIRAEDPDRIVFLAGGQWSTSLEMFGRPFAPNLVYTYHAFWSSSRRDSIQRHIDFSLRHDVPLLIGETGEWTDDWHAAFRELHERLGIGWCFWTYKNLDTPSTVASIRRPEGWADVVAIADGTAPAEGAALARARAAIDAYVADVPLARNAINAGYLRALGMRVPPVPGAAAR